MQLYQPTITGSLLVSGSVITNGTITATTLVVQTVTSSVSYLTGSTQFGSSLANTHIFSGSVTMNPGGLFVSSSGNVGIGTVTPLGSSTEKTLHLSDGGGGYTTLYVTNNSNSLRGIFAVANGASTISVGTQTNTDLRLVTNDTERMRINSSGEVGIGTTSTSGNRFWIRGSSSSSSDTSLFVQNSTPSTLFMVRNDGIVTKPLQPSFRAGRSTSYTPGATTPIVFNSTSGFGFNVGGNYSTSTGRFTAPVSGIYNFTTCIIWESVTNGLGMDDAFTIQVNGSIAAYSFRRAAYVAGTTGVGGYYTDHATVLLNLTAGQYVEVVNRFAGLTVHGNQNYCYFQGYLVG